MASPLPPDGGKRSGFTLLNLALSALGAAFVLAYIHPFGVRMTADTVTYIAAAESFVAGEGFRDVFDRPLGVFPPLFPLVLGTASLGILDPRDVVGPLNAFLVGLTAFVVGQYLRDRLESRILAAWGCLMIALAYPQLLRIYLSLSEPLFVLLAVLALTSTDRFLADGRARTLLWAAGFTALACLTRYIGASLLVLVGLVLLLSVPPARDRLCDAREKRVAVFALVATVPVALWFVRNLLVIGSPTAHPASRNNFESVLSGIRDASWHWIDATNVWATLILLVLVATRWKRIAGFDWRPAWLFGAYLLSYIALFMANLLFGAHIYDAIGSLRFWAPLYPPLMIATLCVLDRILAAERSHPLLGTVGGLPIVRRVFPGARGSVLAGLVVILLSLDAVRTVKIDVATLTYAFRGESKFLELLYNAPRFTGSGTLEYIRETPAVVGTIYTNEPYATYLHASRDGMRLQFFLKAHPELATRLANSPAPTFLVLLHKLRTTGFDNSEYDPDLRTLPSLERVAEFEDGIVYRVVQQE